MRRTLRLLANVKPARYLDAGSPTGLTGLYTHSSPRSTLLYLYSKTLERVNRFPESSLYRKSVEAQTKHRMAIVEAAAPPGHKEWAERAQKLIADNPREFSVKSGARLDGARAVQAVTGEYLFVHRTIPEDVDERYQEWDGEHDVGEGSEGLRGPEEREGARFASIFDTKPLDLPGKVQWEPEPQMTADQYVISLSP